MSWREPRRSQALLAVLLAAAFAISALHDPRLLAACGAVAVVLLRRGAARVLRRLLVTVVPVSGSVALASWVWLRVVEDRPAPVAPAVALVLRATVLAFVTVSALRRINLFHALAAFPAARRLLVITLAQIHALRLVATESAQGLRSRTPNRPTPRVVLANAGALTATLLTLSLRNARDVTDALRSRGF